MRKSPLQFYSDKQVEGTLSKRELDEVADFSDNDELYLRIRILARSFEERFIPILEKFVLYQDDPDVSAAALRGLVVFHNKREYLPLVKRYVSGVDWDTFDQLKLHGIHIAEQYLKNECDDELIGVLISAFENQNNEEVIRDSSHEALMTSAGIDRSDVQFEIAARGLSEADTRLDVIENLKRRIKYKPSPNAKL